MNELLLIGGFVGEAMRQRAQQKHNESTSSCSDDRFPQNDYMTEVGSLIAELACFLGWPDILSPRPGGGGGGGAME